MASHVSVATLPEVPDEVLGYSVIEPGGGLHWTYVKSAYRRQRIASALCQGAKVYTTRTPSGDKLMKALGNMQFNPWF